MSSSGVNLTSMGLNSSTVSSGSGLDVTAVVDQIIETARGPERLWQQQQSKFSAQRSDLNSMNASLNALKTAMNALSDASGALSANSCHLVPAEHSDCYRQARCGYRQSLDCGQ